MLIFKAKYPQIKQLMGHEPRIAIQLVLMVMAQLFPVIFDSDRQPLGRVISACVAGELHEIGARMVADLFEMAGWDTTFLGADVPRDSVVDMLVEMTRRPGVWIARRDEIARHWVSSGG